MPYFKLWRFEKGPRNFYYLKDKYAVENLCCKLCRFYRVTYSNTTSFSIKTFFMKLTTFIISKARDIYRKLSRFSEDSVKIKVR